MSISLDRLAQFTTSAYGFKVGDWDCRSSGAKGLSYLGRCDLSLSNSYPLHADNQPLNLQGLSVEEVGAIFNKVFQGYKNWVANDTVFQPTAIFLRLDGDKIPAQPLLFVLGSKV